MNEIKKIMKIGEVAKRIGISTKSIRYYESLGLIEPPLRAENGYRYYNQTHLEALALIKKSKMVGFSLDECYTLLSLWASPHRKSKEVNSALLKKIEDIDKQVAALLAMKSVLIALCEQCPNDENTFCPILSKLIE